MMQKEHFFLVTDYGVTADKEELQTEGFQKAIEACKNAGGGEIVVPAGIYYIGSIRLYSNMTFHLLEGAKLYGSKDYRDYTDFHVPTTLRYVNDDDYIKAWHLPEYYIYAIICAFEEENITIVGEEDSLINGQDCLDPNGEEQFRGPMGIVLSKCKNICLQGYTFQNSANWSHQIDSCEHVRIEHLTILAGHDGLNLHHCSDIHVKFCRIETGDDCFAGYDIQNLTVENCYLNTACNALRIGGSKILFENCLFEGPGHYPHISEDTYDTHAVLKYYAMAADAVQEDGKDICLKNCQFCNVTKLFAYEHGKREWMQDGRPIRSVTIEHADISGISKESVFKGNGEAGELVLRDVTLSFEPKSGEASLLAIDDSISLILENVRCKERVCIKAEKNSKILMTQCVNLEIE